MRLPVFLGRRPDEPVDDDLVAFHLQLLGTAQALRHGGWALCEPTGWPDDRSCEQLLAWSWTDGDQRSLVVVNDAEAPASARIQLPWDDLAGRTWTLDDACSGDDVRARRHRHGGAGALRPVAAVGLPRPGQLAAGRGGLN